MMSKPVDAVLKETCLEIQKRWEMVFLEIGLDREHAHFLIQSVPTYSPIRIVTTVKSLIAREVFAKVPEVRSKLWGGEFFGERLLREYRGAARQRQGHRCLCCEPR